MIVGVYASHDKAIVALRKLQESGYMPGQLSILAKAELVNNHIHVRPNDSLEKAEVSIGVVAGAILGVLPGLGIITIPGLGLLLGAGAWIGAFGGAYLGFLTGGIVAILTTAMGIDETNGKKYEKHLNEGKFLVFVQGNEDQIKHAQDILHTLDLHVELDAH